MKTLRLLMLFATVLILTSCNKMKDGKYVVVNVEADGGQYNTLPKCSDDTVGGKSIGGFLRDKLKQKQYQLQFKEDFVIVKDIEENEDTILALTNDADGDYYSTQLSKGEDKEKINIQLRPSRSKSGLVLIVDLNVPWNIRYRPAQVGGKFVGGIPCGRAICYLSKLD